MRMSGRSLSPASVVSCVLLRPGFAAALQGALVHRAGRAAVPGVLVPEGPAPQDLHRAALRPGPPVAPPHGACLAPSLCKLS